jgi:hypothetical protein
MELGIWKYEVICLRKEKVEDLLTSLLQALVGIKFISFLTLSATRKAFQYNVVKKDGNALLNITM